MSREEWRAILERQLSDIQEQQRTLEETIRTSDGAQRDEALNLLAETKQRLSQAEESLKWDARHDTIPKLLSEMLEHQPSWQEALRNRDDEVQTKETKLLGDIKHDLPKLKDILDRMNGQWAYEDRVYRFYHGSFKVFDLQGHTEEAVEALIHLAPNSSSLDLDFVKIIVEGTGKEFSPGGDRPWAETTRPILEAFFHARYFLERVCKYGEELDEQSIQPLSGGREPARDFQDMMERLQPIPSGWAAVLTLYGLR